MGCIPRKHLGAKATKPVDLVITPSIFVRENSLDINEVYDFGQSLGRGAFGEVRRAKHRSTNLLRAIKILLKDKPSTEANTELLNEVEMIKAVDHPNIIKVFEYFETPRKSYIVMELCQGGELFDEFSKRNVLKEDDCATVIKQLLSAVSYLHSHNIIHRDLKPENILIETKGDISNVKISDFGTATLCAKNAKIRGALGTVYYVAPEVLLGNYDSKCDMWSIGVIIFTLLSGCPPFDGINDNAILNKILKGNYSFTGPIWANISREAKDLISSLLCPVETRLTAESALNHPWIQRRCPNNQDLHSLGNVLTKLKDFHCASKLKEAVSIFITSQCITSDETKQLKEAFKTLDVSGDGKISKKELADQYTKFMEGGESKAAVEEIMADVDSDKSGFIDYTEFLKATLDRKKLESSENLKAAFNLFDKDKSGTISAAEIRMVLDTGNMANSKIWDEILGEVDTNGDGVIDLREFEALVNKKTIL
ncbi:unnamed protein product [Blepharisma stoltei]|uniref:non-specific serine/threonine protein kinase n=1 Tax=Blepharisma stoltei TaxID=1481888 RepID=A0AAU9J237_9CILI|nr:unnamed protein product [Blepharisma stoltei]